MHVRKVRMFTFVELAQMARSKDHCAHMHDFYTERFRLSPDGSEAYASNWNGIEEFYHRANDARCFD